MSTGEAVRDVRFGLRALFWRAMVPVTPRNFSAGLPNSNATGRAITGPSVMVPEKTNRIPRPSHLLLAPLVTATIVAAPRAIRIRPNSERRRLRATISIAVSRIAASGGTFPARRAGNHADATVTMSPTTMVLTTAELGTTRSPLGRSMLAAFNNALRAFERPMPANNPMVEPNRPTTTDSIINARVTCFFDAPIARRSAFSRWRCAALMENTL